MMRSARIILHVIVTFTILFLFASSLQDLFRGDWARENWFLCISTLVLFFAGCFGLILELRRDRVSAFLNPAIPALFAALMVIDAFVFAEAEAAAFVVLFALVPVTVAALEGILYYMSWASDSFKP